MQTAVDELEAKGKAARQAARALAKLPTRVKDRALLNIAEGLKSRQEEVLEANENDYREGQRNGLTEALLDRLLLNPERLEGMAEDVRKVVMLPDPVGRDFRHAQHVQWAAGGQTQGPPRRHRRYIREPAKT